MEKSEGNKNSVEIHDRNALGWKGIFCTCLHQQIAATQMLSIGSWDQIWSLCTSISKVQNKFSLQNKLQPCDKVYFVCKNTPSGGSFKSVQACQTAQLSQTYYRVIQNPQFPSGLQYSFVPFVTGFSQAKFLSFYQFYLHEDGTILANKEIRGYCTNSNSFIKQI